MVSGKIEGALRKLVAAGELKKEGKESVILREEPFEIAKDSIGYQIHLMIWEKGILNRKVKIESYSLEKKKE